ncbi:MAG TPA: hypothetical protein VFA20_25975 [Myxococcaceae bacterium]|nr:hypothetical protein [Myxococcaceae bacterium]
MKRALSFLAAALLAGAAGCAGCAGDPNGGFDGGATLDGCRLFPSDNPWNQPATGMSPRGDGAAILATMNPTAGLHPDWGNWSADHYGIPWTSGSGAQPVALQWTSSWGASESDPLACSGGGGNFCYPIPTTAPIEGGPAASSGSDRHVLYVDTAGAPDNCTLYELYNAQSFTSAPWRASNGAVFHLGSNALRGEQITSADAAGLPILPGLVRVDEVLQGEIRHAIRFTVNRTATAYIHPATHAAGTSGANLPPMGLRLRLRADFPMAGLSPPTATVVTALKTYGLILADNGSDWYLTGDSDDRWDPLMDALVPELRAVHGSDFEVLDTGPSLPQ